MNNDLLPSQSPLGDIEKENTPPNQADLLTKWRKRHASVETNTSQAFTKRIMAQLPSHELYMKSIRAAENMMYRGSDYEDDDDGVIADRTGREEFYAAMSAKLDKKVPKEDLDWLLGTIPLEDRAKETVDISETVMATVELKCKPDILGNPVVPGMKISLMQHQLLGVKWMVAKEEKPELGIKVEIKNKSKNYGKATNKYTVGGGLLADEMGLGKTIQSIALMVHNRPPRDEPVKTTLIVAPLALIHQWKRELENRTKKGFFSVHIHHGSTQLKKVGDFLQHDVVITTYGTLMAGYPSNLVPKKKNMTDVEKEYWQDWLEERKGVMFQIEWYRIILDEAHIIKNPHVRCSLACANLKSPRKWCLTGTPVQNGLKDMFSLFRFLEVPVFQIQQQFNESFGSDGNEQAQRMQVVLRSLMLRRTKDEKINGRPLIVLPEKIIVEDRINLSEEERSLYAAVEARARVQVNKYLREGVAMKNYSSMLAMIVRLRQLCIHPFLIMEHMKQSWSSEDMATAVTAGAPGQSSMLNRLIEEIAATPAGDWNECPLCLDVPTNAIITVCRHVFCSECINGVFQMPAARGVADGDSEDDEVEALGESIACPVCRHKLHKHNIGAFTAPPPDGKKRQLAPEEAIEAYKKVNWEVIPDDSDDESLPDLETIFKVVPKKEELPAIVEPIIEPVEVVVPVVPDIPDDDEDEDLFEVFKNNPVPKAEVKRQHNKATEDWADLLDRDEKLSSSKLDALQKQVTQWQEEHPEDKIIIFSQFTRALDLVEKMCDQEGWGSSRYQGDMSLEEREASLRRFEDEDEVTILLTSLKCGGVGLNLTVANRVVCLDLWWNWQIENQAIDRAHRTGQKKPVSVTRIIVKDSVEERILQLQERKKEVAAAALGDNHSGRIGKLSLRELIGLFGKVTTRNGQMEVE